MQAGPFVDPLAVAISHRDTYNSCQADCPNEVAAVFSQYVCKGQRSASGEEELGPQATEVSGVAVSAAAAD